MISLTRRQSLAGLAAAAVASPAVLRAAPRVMTINSWLPGPHPVPAMVLSEWAQTVERRTEGRVAFEILEKPLGPPPAAWEIVQEGRADVAYALHGYEGDAAFPRAQVGQFSRLGDSYSATQAFSSVYWEQLDPEAEHGGVELLATFLHGPGQLFLKNRSIRSLEDFRGLRLRTSGGFISQLLQELGAETVAMPPFAVRDAMAEGKIDGVAFPYEGALSFDIADQATEVAELPGGYYNATWWLAMSQTAFDDLGRRDRRMVERVSREFVPLLSAKAFDYVDYEGKTLFETRGIPVREASDELLAALGEAADRYEARWNEGVQAAGFDGARALRKMRQLTGVNRG